MGRFVVLGTLGEGGMGTVLEAFDRTLDRRVALKVLRHGIAAQHRERLVREAKAMAKLSHPNVVQVYEVGEADSETFIAMEFLRGQTLREWSDREPRPGWRASVEVYLQAGEGLSAAHGAGVIHRDFKPTNAFIDERDRVRVLDFGLARRASTPPTSRAPLPSVVESDSLAFDTPLTRTGAVLGTPAYMPPEQLEGHEADERSDQFSFCVALYEALYGRRPFEGRTIAELRASLAAGVPTTTPPGSGVPTSLRRILIRGLATAPEERWPSMDALLGALRRQVAPRKRARVVIGGVIGVGLLSVGFAQYSEFAGRCSGARGELEGIWDEAQRQKLGDAIVATELSYAEDTRDRVLPRLDEYASRWVGKHTEVCEATSVRREQSTEVMDLRMACLRTRRVALAEAVSVLAEADATRVEGAINLVTRLPSLDRCDDVEALRSTLPIPEDEQTAADVERLREQLARVRAMWLAGAVLDALELVEPIVTQAEILRFAPLVAEARYERGSILRHTGDPEAAASDSEAAYLSAAALRHREVEGWAVTQLASVTGVGLAQHASGLQWAKTALALARDPYSKVKALGATGGISRAAGEYEAALDSFERSLVLSRDDLGPAHPTVSTALNNVGTVLESMGRYDEALARFSEALALDENNYGPDHPNIAHQLNNICVALLKKGDAEQALGPCERALAIRERALGPRSLAAADSLENIGIAHGKLGRFDDEAAAYKRALEIRTERLGAEHPKTADSVHCLGESLQRRGQPGLALEHFRRALAAREASLGEHHANVGASLDSIGAILVKRGEFEEALAVRRRALAIREQAMGREHPDVARSRHGIAQTLRKLGKHDAALVEFKRALEIKQVSLGPRHPSMATTLNSLGTLYRDRGELDEALAYLERALSIKQEVNGPEHPAVCSTLHNIGLIHQDRGELEQAKARFERVLAITERASGPDHPNLAYPLTGLGVVDRVYTDLAVIAVTPEGFRVIECAPGIDLETVRSKTGAEALPPANGA